MSSSSNESSIDALALPNFEQLPDNYLIRLTNFSAVAVSGEEQNKYLQGQVTCDVNALAEQNLLIGGHCDAKGKLLSVFRLVEHQQTLLLLQPIASLEKSLAELKKFGVFAKVKIEQSPLDFLACGGAKSHDIIMEKFGVVPDELSPVVQKGETTIVYVAGNTQRYLIIDTEQNNTEHAQELSLPFVNEAVWSLLEITEGFPVLPNAAVQQFVPQMLNLDAIGGISFNKGCYLGQETVARMQYLGKNKKAMGLFKGALDSSFAELSIEKQIGDNWRNAGDTLSFYQSDTGECYIQAVVASDLNADSNLRFKQQPSSTVSMIALPYSTQ